MFLDKFYNINDEKISFAREQASNFAKQIADDFNPLHDVTAKRFCVPGDLLFALVLTKSGLQQNMSFTFSGMVTDESILTFPSEINESAAIVDDNGKEYMTVSTNGEKTTKASTIESLIRSYVEFSGHTFPDMLIKLMADKQVMINPARPMVMYESMSIHLDTVDVEEVSLQVSDTTLTVEGKRGQACLEFDLMSNGEVIGHGKKYMVLSGLRAYCQETIDTIVSDYHQKKVQYREQLAIAS
ncbi:DUF3581 family protein [Thalassotalea sp. PLHSN55]|uniref:DUF3581 family protein n=1 Tax=Thalassotalea sp. PLHSN55 TaxID=3435888 RepID=UPI003F828E1C